MVYFEKRNGVVLQAKAEFLASGEDPVGGRLPMKDDLPVSGVERRASWPTTSITHDISPRPIVNRMWGVFFGRGFVNPMDDFNDQNQPSNPELLDELAVRLKNYNYDQKKLIRWICNSDAYNLSCVANSTNDKPGAGSAVQPHADEVDEPGAAVRVAGGGHQGRGRREQGRQEGRARPSGWTRWSVNFGDDEGNEVNFNGTVVQALLMMNGEDINDAIGREDKGTVALAMKKHGDRPALVIKELFLATLNREPTAKEMTIITSQFRFHPAHIKLQAEDNTKPERKYQDLLWALVNSNEFLLNH